MSSRTAVRATRAWTHLYTMCLPRAARERRRAEVESDLFESLADPNASNQILSRLLFGAIDDLTWSITQMERTAREALWWSAGSVLTVSLVALWLVFPPDGAPMLTWSWAWPLASVLHVLGVITFIGLRTVVDLRLTTGALGTVPVSSLVRKLMPATILAAVVMMASGLAMYMADAARMSAHPLFQLKLLLLTAALVNAWFMHAVTFRNVGAWDEAAVAPRGARLGGVVSLILWAGVIVSSMLTPFVF